MNILSSLFYFIFKYFLLFQKQPTTQEEKAYKLAELKARISSNSANEAIKNIVAVQQLTIKEQLEQRQQTVEERERSLNLIIDSEGRTVDRRTGEVVQIQSHIPTLKVNTKRKRDATGAEKKQTTDLFASGIASTISGGVSSVIASKLPASQNELAASNTSAEAQSEKFFDTRLKIKPAIRNKRKLAFNDKGKYQDIANKLRAKAKLHILQQEIAEISKKTGISSESRLALIQPKPVLKETVPTIEWWDYAVLNEMNYDCLDKMTEGEDGQLRDKLKITQLIEHPVQLKPPTFTEKKIVPAVILTAKERKKLRRQNRSEALKEEQEKIRLGLIPPPEPKG
jgi:U4/U6 small nuclear ribonucleoprotein PRP3